MQARQRKWIAALRDELAVCSSRDSGKRLNTSVAEIAIGESRYAWMVFASRPASIP
jgi:hypothetical protein